MPDDKEFARTRLGKWLEKQREKERSEAAKQLRAAGITERRDGGGVGLMSEPLLVFRGSKKVLTVFDQDANEIGAAIRRNRHSDLREAQLGQWDSSPSLLTVARDRWFVAYSTYVVNGPTGEPIALVGRPRLAGFSQTMRTMRPVTFEGDLVGHLKLSVQGPFGGHGILEDVEGAEVADIVRQEFGHYVAVITPSAAEPLRTIAVAASIVWTLADTPPNSGGM